MSEAKILVVDDNPTNLDLLSRILRKAQYDVSTADGGARALEVVASERPDLVMLDIEMPDMDGYEVCTRLKDDAVLSEIPVIFVSALDDVVDKVKAFDLGGVDYVTKPFRGAEVIARVKTQLKLSRLQRELAERNRRIEAQNVELGVKTQALEAANAELTRLSTTDHLTGLANRRHFIEVVENEMRISDRHQTPLAVVMLDIDHFKMVNDTHGHEAGDVVLRHVAATLRASLRTTDVVARWGGEEFMILLRHTDRASAVELGEKLRAALASEPVEPAGKVTASFGVTSYVAPETFASLSARADDLLYMAKKEGRDRVES